MKYKLILVLQFSTFSSIHSQDWAQLYYYKEANELLPKPKLNEKRVVFIGNSITLGWNQPELTLFKNPEYINRGIGGQTTAQMKIRFFQDVISLKPKAVVILGGINDIAQNQGYVSINEIATNILEMAKLANTYGIKVIICSTLPANVFAWKKEIRPAHKIIALNKLLKRYCLENNYEYLDYYTAMVNEDLGMKEALTFDGVHCNLAGYRFMEPMIKGMLMKVLKEVNN